LELKSIPNSDIAGVKLPLPLLTIFSKKFIYSTDVKNGRKRLKEAKFGLAYEIQSSRKWSNYAEYVFQISEKCLLKKFI